MQGAENDIWRRVGWETVPENTNSTAPSTLVSPLQTPKTLAFFDPMGPMASPLPPYYQQDGLSFLYMGTPDTTTQSNDTTMSQLQQRPTLGQYSISTTGQCIPGYWSHDQNSVSPLDQYGLNPWNGEANNPTPAHHEHPIFQGPPAREAVSAQKQSQGEPTSPKQRSNPRTKRRIKRHASPDEQRNSYRAYHRGAGMKKRKQEREEKERMEAEAQQQEQLHANLMAKERALTEERLALREELYLHAKMCNDEKILEYLSLTARPM